MYSTGWDDLNHLGMTLTIFWEIRSCRVTDMYAYMCAGMHVRSFSSIYVGTHVCI